MRILLSSTSEGYFAGGGGPSGKKKITNMFYVKMTTVPIIQVSNTKVKNKPFRIWELAFKIHNKIFKSKLFQCNPAIRFSPAAHGKWQLPEVWPPCSWTCPSPLPAVYICSQLTAALGFHWGTVSPLCARGLHLQRRQAKVAATTLVEKGNNGPLWLLCLHTHLFFYFERDLASHNERKGLHADWNSTRHIIIAFFSGKLS